MKKLVIAFSCILLLSGCGANAAKKQLLVAAGTFEASQIVIETRLASPIISEDEKATLKRFSQEGTTAIEVANHYLYQGQDDQLAQQMGLIHGLITYIRYTLYPLTPVGSPGQEVPPPSTIVPQGSN